MYSNYNNFYTSSLYHSGVKGMKWGIRRTVTSQHNLDIKNNWTVAKNKAKAGVLSKQSE